jgi:hypothetical protein
MHMTGTTARHKTAMMRNVPLRRDGWAEALVSQSVQHGGHTIVRAAKTD